MDNQLGFLHQPNLQKVGAIAIGYIAWGKPPRGRKHYASTLFDRGKL
ncbi:hypothetical protein [Planktothricoides raciborskii]|uniref:Uncharacterized protein n=1 Tax=Planktothricoides raciborskii FACHB-1370 TaxID=2949576 RepID=A0ABR8EID1_9CYAN|nr:hypothetical protein [Planktothricoides raciborskii]MBD2546057.1 hypothetical protein [Planktothricoides raciborskii FACHB-1370]MBD2584315.1 hypothetical protein [Planktothricoides raciborskii FACHB-1261]